MRYLGSRWGRSPLGPLTSPGTCHTLGIRCQFKGTSACTEQVGRAEGGRRRSVEVQVGGEKRKKHGRGEGGDKEMRWKRRKLVKEEKISRRHWKEKRSVERRL